MDTEITSIKPGDVFTHNESGKACVVVCIGSMKEEGGSWEDAVTYSNPSGQNPERYFTRRTVAFRELFTRGAKE